jgi:hypothetical protein
MIFSTIAYSFMSRGRDPNTKKAFLYNGIAFVQNQEYFIGSVSNYQIVLLNNPKSNDLVAENKIERDVSSFYLLPLYIDSKDDLANSIISQNLGPNNGVAQRVQFACFEEEGCKDELPIKDCSENLIIVRYSNDTTRIEGVGNCVFIHGKEEEMSQVIDKFILGLFSP